MSARLDYRIVECPPGSVFIVREPDGRLYVNVVNPDRTLTRQLAVKMSEAWKIAIEFGLQPS